MKNVVITGSTRGIGYAMAVEFLKAGCTVAKFFIPCMLNNTKNNVQIAWLTNGKVAWRFMTAASRKNRLIKSVKT